MIKYKHIEAMREVRLWIGQVVVPAVTASILIGSSPTARAWLREKKEEIKNKFKRN